ncbi:MAG: hypothetical protein AAGA85_02830 [Bacteroidota bacterium]
MSRAILLFIGSLMELGAGSLLLVLPGPTSTLLVEVHVVDAGLTFAQMLGAGLVSMGIMLLFVSKTKDRATLGGVTVAYILYNLAGIGVMSFGAINRGHEGDALWFAVALHTVLVVLLLRAHLRAKT